MPHLEGMNDEQRAAILAPIVPMKVLAGPGSGKSPRAGRSCHASHQRARRPAVHILFITFTNKAAREMRERLHLSVGVENANAITAGTFHSVASRMLRKHVHLLESCGRATGLHHLRRGRHTSAAAKILVETFNEDKKKVDLRDSSRDVSPRASLQWTTAWA